jgi:signal transduction histidine kinase
MIDFYIINNLAIFLVNLIGALIALWILFANIKARTNQSFFFMTFFILLWIDFVYISDLPSQVEHALLFNRLIFGAVFLFFVSFYFFSIFFPKAYHRNVILDKIVLISGVIFSLISVFTDFVAKDIEVREWGTEIVFGEGGVVFFAIVICLTLFIIIRLLYKYYKFSVKERIRIQYLLAGIIIFVGLNLIFNVVLYPFWGSFPYYYFGNYSAIFLLGLGAYAVVTNNLMGVKTLVTQALIVAMSIILILDIVVLSDNLTVRLLKFGVLLTFLYFSKELVKSVKKEKRAKERLEEVNYDLEERNNDLKILFEASSKFNQELDSRKISQNIVNSIPRDLKYLGYKLGFIALYDKEDDRVFVYAVTDSALVRKVEQKLNISLKTFEERLSQNNDLIVRTIRNKKEFVSDKLEDFIEGFMGGEKADSFQKTLGAKSFISVPLFSSGQAIGAIVFASGKRKDDITIRNKNIIRAFSSHIGSAIENAQLYEKTESQMEEVAKLNKNLRKANKDLKALWKIKSEFLHIASHQLRTPLTAMRGMISMWLAGDFDSLSEEQRKEMLRRIATSTERLNGITNDMLSALEHEGGVAELKFQKISVIEMIKDIMSTLGPGYVEKGLYLRFGDVDEDIPSVEAEPNYLSQVFSNLIDNACKYTQKGGTEISVKKSDKFVDIFIKDTGIGIPKKDKGRIFDKFTRGENAMAENASGTGLGLFIVKKILDEQNGKISFESSGEGEGTMFKVSLIIKQENK